MLFDLCAPIINVAYFALPWVCEYVDAYYWRSVTPPPSSQTKEKKTKIQIPVC